MSVVFGFARKFIPLTLKTDRFALVNLPATKVARLTYPWTADPDLMGSLGKPVSGWTFRKWRKNFKHVQRGKGYCFAIYPTGSQDLIGYENVHLEKDNTAHLTVAIADREWWGKGVVVETRTAILDHLFNHTPCQRACGLPAAQNRASVFNYQALGFTAEGILRKHNIDHQNDQMVDAVFFGMLRGDWVAKPQVETPGIPTAASGSKAG